MRNDVHRTSVIGAAGEGPYAQSEGSEAFRQRVVREFQSLKAINRFDENIARGMALRDGLGYLTCVCELHADDRRLIAQLAQFREEAKTFHNRFRVTLEGTARWLRSQLLDVPDRILFLVLNRHGHVIGHLGFAHPAEPERGMELDNVIRGVQGSDPGIMSAAVEALLNWADHLFSPFVFRLRTLDDNLHAMQFYARLGFHPTGRQPLRRVETPGEINHIPLPDGDTAPPDRYFVCMSRPPRLAA